MVDETLYCGNHGHLINGDKDILYVASRRAIFCNWDCLDEYGTVLVAKEVRAICFTPNKVSRTEALKLLKSGGIEARVEPQEKSE